MNSPQLHPQYLLNAQGEKNYVVLSIEEYEALLEDLHDLAVIAERKDEPSISLDNFIAGLKKDGCL